MSSPRLGAGAEFDLIRRLTADWTDGVGSVRGIVVGPGDDAAVLEGGWVVSTDLAIQDIHFRRAWMEPAEVGARAVVAALSDLAAMAAEPVAILLSIAGPGEDLQTGFFEAVGRGARDAAARFGAALIGGDVSRSPGPLVVDVVALGRTDAPALRSGALPGDRLYVTGRLGGAAAALECLLRGESPPAELRRRFARPTPRIREARQLASSGHLHALIDLSDGLAGDAAHLAAASDVGIEVDVASVPIDGWARSGGQAEAMRRALSGGEDYELLFAAAPAIEADLPAFDATFPDAGVTPVGRVVAGAGVRFLDADGAPLDPGRGWDHFAAPGAEGAT